eukprot:UN05389
MYFYLELFRRKFITTRPQEPKKRKIRKKKIKGRKKKVEDPNVFTNKMLCSLFTGIRRAYPYAQPDPEVFQRLLTNL